MTNEIDIVVRAGQVWGDSEDLRELTVRAVDSRYAYCMDDEGKRTRILKRRMVPRKDGYYLKRESPARYQDVASETGDCKCGKGHKMAHHLEEGCRRCRKGTCSRFNPDTIYGVWTGDEFSPAHCPCEDFRWATRQPGHPYRCKHLKLVLFGKGMI